MDIPTVRARHPFRTNWGIAEIYQDGSDKKN